MRIPRVLLPHRVAVEVYEGQGAYGPIYADPVTVRAYVEDARRVVRRQQDGAEVISESTVRTAPHHVIPAQSRITVWPGAPYERTAEVITSSRYQHPGTPSHLELALT